MNDYSAFRVKAGLLAMLVISGSAAAAATRLTPCL